MSDAILLDGASYQLHELDLPLLIHGKENSGASYFSIALLIDLYRKGKDVIMLSGFSHARDAFLHETHARSHSVLIEDESSLEKAEHKRIIFLKREKTFYLTQLLQMPRMSSRIFMIKNIELFAEPVIAAISTHKHLILSGNIDESPLKYQLLAKHFASKIYFSPLLAQEIVLPPLPEFSGYMVGREKTGIVTVKKE